MRGALKGPLACDKNHSNIQVDSGLVVLRLVVF
jgi:hypothetical protein